MEAFKPPLSPLILTKVGTQAAPLGWLERPFKLGLGPDFRQDERN